MNEYGIYSKEFVDYLKSNLGYVKSTVKDFIVPCPWCDLTKTNRSKDHLWISKESPIFHCFRAGCEKRGIVNKLIKKLSGVDKTDEFVDKSLVDEYHKKHLTFQRNVYKPKDIIIPPLYVDQFPAKALYLKQRIKFANIAMEDIKGLVFDIDGLIRQNNVHIDDKLSRLAPYLHTNFIGFVTENQSSVILRNVVPNASFRYYKLRLQDAKFLDYYRLGGHNKNSRDVIISEGIFDIFTEHIFDKLNMKNIVRLYASALSSSFHALLKSIVFHEQIFRLNVHILSDRGIAKNKYEALKHFNKHIIDSLTVYYNRTGKDFNDTPLIIDKLVI